MGIATSLGGACTCHEKSTVLGSEPLILISTQPVLTYLICRMTLDLKPLTLKTFIVVWESPTVICNLPRGVTAWAL
jgi:hypothetical protein